MKPTTFSLLIAGLLTAPRLFGQTPATVSGKITYEVMRQFDPSQMRGFGNGPGAPAAAEPADGAPQVISFTQKLIFAGSFAREERDRPANAPMRRNRAVDADGAAGPGAGGPPPGMRTGPPFGQQTYLDLAHRQRIDVLTLKTDSVSTTYRTERPLPKNDTWQANDKTRKIAGYTCHKATAKRRDEVYTIWYTTDLPVTYSPIAELTPPAGLVLQIESDSESYKAQTVSLEAVDAGTVQPPANAKPISPDQMDQLRQKVRADFRQRMIQNMPARN